MPAWLWPAVKMILPHVGNIVAAAKPVFTKKTDVAAGEGGVVPQQIAELQAAASENAAHIKELAEQLRLTVAALEQAATETERRMARAYRFAVSALAVAIAAVAVGIYAVVT